MTDSNTTIAKQTELIANAALNIVLGLQKNEPLFLLNNTDVLPIKDATYNIGNNDYSWKSVTADGITILGNNESVNIQSNIPFGGLINLSTNGGENDSIQIINQLGNSNNAIDIETTGTGGSILITANSGLVNINTNPTSGASDTHIADGDNTGDIYIGGTKTNNIYVGYADGNETDNVSITAGNCINIGCNTGDPNINIGGGSTDGYGGGVFNGTINIGAKQSAGCIVNIGSTVTDSITNIISGAGTNGGAINIGQTQENINIGSGTGITTFAGNVNFSSATVSGLSGGSGFNGTYEGNLNLNDSGTGNTQIGNLSGGTMYIDSATNITIQAGNNTPSTGNITIHTTGGNNDQIQLLNQKGNKSNAINIETTTTNGGITLTSSGGGVNLGDTGAGNIILATNTGNIFMNSGSSNVYIQADDDIDYGNTLIGNQSSGGIVTISSANEVDIISGCNNNPPSTGIINIKTFGTSSDQINIKNQFNTSSSAINIETFASGGGVSLTSSGGGVNLIDNNKGVITIDTLHGDINIGLNSPNNINIGNGSSTININGQIGFKNGSMKLDINTHNITLDTSNNGTIYIGNTNINTIDIGNTNAPSTTTFYGNVDLSNATVNYGSGGGSGFNGTYNASDVSLNSDIGSGYATNIGNGNNGGYVQIQSTSNITLASTFSEQNAINLQAISGGITLQSTTMGVNINTNTNGDNTNIGSATGGDINIITKDTVTLQSGNKSLGSSGTIIIQTDSNIGDSIFINNKYGTDDSGNKPIEIIAQSGSITIDAKNSVNIQSDGFCSGGSVNIGNTTNGGDVSINSLNNINLMSNSTNILGPSAISLSAPTGGIELSSGYLKLDTNGDNNDQIILYNTKGKNSQSILLNCHDPSGGMTLSTSGGGINIIDNATGNINIYSTNLGGAVNINKGSSSTTTIGNTSSGGKLLLQSASEIDFIAGNNSSTGTISILTNTTSNDNITIKNTFGNSSSAIDIEATTGGIKLHGYDGILLDSSNGPNSISMITNGGGINIQDNATGNIKILSDGGGTISLLNTKNGTININTSIDTTGTANISCQDTTTSFTGTVDFTGDITLNTTGSGKTTIGNSTDGGIIDIISANDISISTTKDDATAITLTTNGGTSEKIVLTNTQGTDSDAISLVSSAGGIDINAYNGINIDAGSHYSNIGTINISTDGTINDQIIITNTQGTNTEAIKLVSSVGGITLESKYGGININSQSDSDVVTIGNTGRVDIASGDVITLQAKGSGVLINTTTNNNTTIGNISSDGGIVKMESSILDNNAIILNAPDGYISLLGKNLDLNNTGGGNTNIGSKDHMGIVNILSNTYGVNINASGGDAVTIGNSSSAGVNLSGTNGSISIGNTGVSSTGVNITSKNNNGVNINTSGTDNVTIGSSDSGNISLTSSTNISLNSYNNDVNINTNSSSGNVNIGNNSSSDIYLKTGSENGIYINGESQEGKTYIGNNTDGGIVKIESSTNNGTGDIILNTPLGTTATTARAISLISDGGGVTINDTNDTTGVINIGIETVPVVNIATVNGTVDQVINIGNDDAVINFKAKTINGITGLSSFTPVDFTGDFTGPITFNTSGTSSTIIGNTTTAGLVSIASNKAISLLSTYNDTTAISLTTDSGTSENIIITNTQGTGNDAIKLYAKEGGIELNGYSEINIDAGQHYVHEGIININTDGTNSDKISITNTQGTAPDCINISTNINSGGILLGTNGGGNICLYNTNGGSLLVNTTTNTSGVNNIACYNDSTDIMGGSISISSIQNDATAITLTTNGGTSEKIVITSKQGTNPDAISLVSSAGGISLQSTVGGININTSGTDAVNIGNTGVTTTFYGTVDFTGVTVDGLSGGSGFSGDYDGEVKLNTTGSAITTIGSSTAGDITLISGTNSGTDITLTTDGGTSEKIVLTNKQGTSVDAISLLSSAGGISLQSTVGGVNINTNNSHFQLDDINISLYTGSAIIGMSWDTGNIELQNKGSIIIGKTNTKSIYIGNKDATTTFKGTVDFTDVTVDGLSGGSGFTGDYDGDITLNTTGSAITTIGSSTAGDITLISGTNSGTDITLTTDGGTSEKIVLTNKQGTSVDAISLLSSAGGITLQSTSSGININTSGTDAINIGNTGVTTTFKGTVDLSSASVNSLIIPPKNSIITASAPDNLTLTLDNTYSGQIFFIDCSGLSSINSYIVTIPLTPGFKCTIIVGGSNDSTSTLLQIKGPGFFPAIFYGIITSIVSNTTTISSFGTSGAAHAINFDGKSNVSDYVDIDVLDSTHVFIRGFSTGNNSLIHL